MKVNIHLEFDSEAKKDTAVLAAIAGILAGAVDVNLADVDVDGGKAVGVSVSLPEEKPATARRKGRTKTAEEKAAEVAANVEEQKAAVEAMAKAAVEELKPVKVEEPKPEVKAEPAPQPKPEVKAEPAPQPKPEAKPEPKPEPKPAPVVQLDYAKDVRPLIIRFVQATSHERVLQWLQDTFSVQSAMKIPADQLGKAKELLDAELAKFESQD